MNTELSVSLVIIFYKIFYNIELKLTQTFIALIISLQFFILQFILKRTCKIRAWFANDPTLQRYSPSR